MEKSFNKNLWSFIGRFIVIYVVTYAVVSFLFLTIQSVLPEKTALEFYRPYRPLGGTVILAEAIKAGILGLILYPFYHIVVKRKRSWLILFGTLWGLVVLGSLQPLPGSIEGMIYTKTTMTEHIMVLVASAVQVILFISLFLPWERRIGAGFKEKNPKINQRSIMLGYISRFVLLYVIIYALAGIAFFMFQDYESELSSQESFALFRPTDHPIVIFAIPFQILRGSLLALFLYPFFDRIVNAKRGWLLLFVAFFGLAVLASPVAIPDMIESLVSKFSIADSVVGTPEIIVQLLVFSVIFFFWERRIRKKKGEKEGNTKF